MAISGIPWRTRSRDVHFWRGCPGDLYILCVKMHGEWSDGKKISFVAENICTDKIIVVSLHHLRIKLHCTKWKYTC